LAQVARDGLKFFSTHVLGHPAGSWTRGASCARQLLGLVYPPDLFGECMWAVVNSNSTSWNVVERLCFPSPRPTYTVASFPRELIFIPRSDGFDVPCVFLPFRHARFLVLYFHGNAEDLGSCYPFCSVIRDLFQVHVLAVEYPGYGVCAGTSDEAGLMANADAAMTFVLETLHWPRDGVKLLGRSLGTAPCVALAAKQEVAGVILVAPFLSIREIFRSQVGRMADLVMDRFPNYLLAQHIRSPTLIVHGQLDTLIPCEHGRRIYDSVPAKKMMVCPALMGHNSCLLRDVSDFVLPMTQFFSLPDYTFEDIVVPDWVYQQRPPVVRSPDRMEVAGPSAPRACEVPTPPTPRGIAAFLSDRLNCQAGAPGCVQAPPEVEGGRSIGLALGALPHPDSKGPASVPPRPPGDDDTIPEFLLHTPEGKVQSRYRL